jgi:hypothetical protein
MPGWYVHAEAARIAAERLRAGDVPSGYPLSTSEAIELGELAHTWRNYLALGALGPDLFYLLPDYSSRGMGEVIRRVIKTSLEIWEVVDDEFVSHWEKWIDPVSANEADLSAQLSGGLSNQLGESLALLAGALGNMATQMITQLGDLWGILTSGVPRGFGESAFYWSDMFHYRKTYQYPWQLYRQAKAERDAPAGDTEQEREHARKNAEARMVFALGWMSHCATDVTGHAWTNAKTGGPFRLHWQRHHLVENHMDAHNHNMRRTAGPFYSEYGTSALHFRIAFRSGTLPDYAGRDDQPAYDYFTGFPAYPLAKTAVGRLSRHQFFDLDTAQLPGHLCEALLTAMRTVYGEDPRILETDPAFSDGGSGRPNADALQEMWQIVYRYLKMVGSDGLAPTMPLPPDLINDHSPPVPPGFDSVGDDPARGVDLGDDDFNLLDLILALFALAVYVYEVVTWLVTVLPGLVVDVLTFPARDVVYRNVLVPIWNMYMMSRRLLVHEAFLMPKPEEIDRGLVTLGLPAITPEPSLAASLDSLSGFAPGVAVFIERSGRRASDAYGTDPAFPRQIVHDRQSLMGALHLINRASLPWIDSGTPPDPSGPSAWLAPWRYPERNQAGERVGWEGELTHPGPHIVGEDTSILLARLAGTPAAISTFESAASPAATEKACDTYLPQGEHLGGPVDYSIYLIGQLASGAGARDCPVPDFNLDADRGYGYHCWDWNRTESQAPDLLCTPDLNTDAAENTRFTFHQPCTVPEHYDTVMYDKTPTKHAGYAPGTNLAIHYLDPSAPPPPGSCDNKPIGDDQIRQAGMPPEGGN